MGQDVRASRIIGVAARLCLEMGLNRREVLERAYPEQHARDLAVTVFWSTYLLDMRASCGTGIPCVIQEVDVDPTLPEPVSTSHHSTTDTYNAEAELLPSVLEDNDQLRSTVKQSLEGREFVHQSSKQTCRG